MEEFFARLKAHKLVQWTLGYIAVSFALLPVLDIVAERFGWSQTAVRCMIIALGTGFFMMLVIAWYHGERGEQRVTRTEHAILATLLLLGGLAMWRIGPGVPRPDVANAGVALHATAASKTIASEPIATPAPIPAKSIAVLPFENLSADQGNAYFADGMQDLILTKLADIGDLKVISRTSTAKYESHPDDLKAIGQQLGVATILEGSVQKAGNQVLIDVQLINANTDNHIWAQSYQRNLTNIFGVEGEVAEKIAAALKAKLTSAETARLANVPTTNAAAYNAFLQGEYYAQRGLANFSKADLLAAFDHYRKAVSNDPRFALAWAQQAYWQLLYFHFFGNDQPDLLSSAKASIDRAFALQPHLEQAYLAKGLYLYYVKEDVAGAATAFATAHRLKPQDALPVFTSGLALESLGKRDAAIEAFRQASALDPRQIGPLLDLANVYMTEHRYADAERELKQALAIDPSSVFAATGLTEVYALTGNLDAMQSLLDGAPTNVKATLVFKQQLAQYFIYRRQWAKARTMLLEVQAAGQPDWNTECMLGEVERLAGDLAKARPYYQRCADLLPEATRHSANGDAEPGYLGLALVHLGRTTEALAQGQRGIAAHPPTGKQGHGALLLMAQIQAQAGMVQDAVTNLDRLLSISASGGTISVPLLQIDPVWDPLRRDPRFQALLKKYSRPVPASAASVEPASAISVEVDD